MPRARRPRSMTAALDVRRAQEFARAFEAQILSLRDLYRRAASDMMQVLVDAGASAFTRARAIAHLRQYQTILGTLRDESAAWMEANLPASYKAGLKFTDGNVRDLHRAGVNLRLRQRDVFSLVHQEAVAAVVQEMQRVTDFAIAQIGRRAEDVFRRVGIEEVAKGIAEGKARLEVSRDIAQRLLTEGKSVFRDRLGRPWELDRYAETVARTTTREAMTQGTINRLREHNVELAQVSAHNAADFCIYYENVVVSLTGESVAGYPPISAIDGGPPFHPNCVHVLTPFVESLATEQERAAGTIDPDLLNRTPADMQRRFRRDFPKRAQAEGRRIRQQAALSRVRAARRASGGSATTEMLFPARISPASDLPAGLQIRDVRRPTDAELARVQSVLNRLPAEPRSLFGERQRIGMVIQSDRPDFTIGAKCAFTPDGVKSDTIVRHELLHTALNRDAYGGNMLEMAAGYLDGGHEWLAHAQDAFRRAGGGLEGALNGAREEATMLLTIYRSSDSRWAAAAAREFASDGLTERAAAARIRILRRVLGWEG